MKKSEQPVYEYLSNLDLGLVVYEPDGNTPPDFLINGRIAIEARLLNHNYFDDKDTEGLAQTSIPLEKVVRDTLIGFGPPSQGEASWFVSYMFWRPKPRKSDVIRALTDYLNAFNAGHHDGANKRVLRNLDVGLNKANKSHSAKFLLGSYVDRDASGFVFPTMQRNIKYCSDEKTFKIAGYRQKYPEWWLVLVDRINMGINEGISVDHDWDKLIVVASEDASKSYEIPGHRAKVPH